MTMNRKEQKTVGTARKIGRPRKFTPERFEKVFKEYRKWAKASLSMSAKCRPDRPYRSRVNVR